jgi:LysR family hydrogen peroxide-inducible transcriptional activator
MKFTLKQMRYAVALAETGHFGQAAARCHVTQSALSQQLKLTEQACGAKLFVRHGGKAKPTPFGREFVARAESILQSAEMLDSFTLNYSGKPRRPISFGLIPTVAPYLLADIYPALRAAQPGVAIEVREIQTEQIIAQLQDGTLDVGLIATEAPAMSQLTQVPIAADPFVVATGAASKLSGPVRAADLPQEHILLLDEGHCLRDQAMDACALSQNADRRAFAATSLSTIVECVANGQGITLLPSISLKKEAVDPRIRILALEAPGASRTLSLVWHKSSPFGQLFQSFAEIIRPNVLALSAWDTKKPAAQKAPPA